jgi:hypothetical protein
MVDPRWDIDQCWAVTKDGKVPERKRKEYEEFVEWARMREERRFWVLPSWSSADARVLKRKARKGEVVDGAVQ